MKGYIKTYSKAGEFRRLLPSRQDTTLIKSGSVEITQGGVDLLRLTVTSSKPVDWTLGERAEVYGRSYTLNRLPQMKKDGAQPYTYTLEWEGRAYDLLRVAFDLTVDTTRDTAQDLMEIALTGTAERMMEVLTSNARRVYGAGSWQMGKVPRETETKTLSFAETDNCLGVLKRICKEWRLEYRLREESSGTVYIDLVPEGEGERLPEVYAVERGRGLYSLERQSQEATSIVTRLKVYGSRENLPHRYRSARLCLPGKSKAESYIEDAEAIKRLGLWEATKIFEDIQPQRTGTLTGVDPKNPLKVTDGGMFNLSERGADGSTLYLIAGKTAHLHFTTGALAGYDFEVADYNHQTKTFTLNPHPVKIGAETRDLPNETLKFQKGDQYKLVDVALPPEYAKTAEEELQRQGAEYLKQNAQPRLKYTLTLSERAVAMRESLSGGAIRDVFTIGDYIHVRDEDMGVDKHIRLHSITRDALNPYDYKLTLSEAVEYTLFQRMISQQIERDRVIKTIETETRERAERAQRQVEEMRGMVFDAEGNYYSEKIKPLSIETKHISIGARKEQVFVSGLPIFANQEGNPSRVGNGEGRLTHLSIEDKPRTWTIAGGGSSALEHAERPYYIYVEAPREGDEAKVFYSTEPLGVDARAGAYIFQIGVLHSPTDGVRGVTLTHGTTMINGRFITTGRIESIDKGTYFDLDAGEIGGNIRFRGGQDIEGVLKAWGEANLPKLEDDYLHRAIRDGSTEISGGLIATGVIAVKDSEGRVTGYMSGDAERSSFIVAGSKGLGDLTPSIDIRHDGRARLGQLNIDGQNGVITAKETASSPSYLQIGGGIPRLHDILNRTRAQGVYPFGAGRVSLGHWRRVHPGGLYFGYAKIGDLGALSEILHYGQRLTFQGGDFIFTAETLTPQRRYKVVPVVFVSYQTQGDAEPSLAGYAYGSMVTDPSDERLERRGGHLLTYLPEDTRRPMSPDRWAEIHGSTDGWDDYLRDFEAEHRLSHGVKDTRRASLQGAEVRLDMSGHYALFVGAFVLDTSGGNGSAPGIDLGAQYSPLTVRQVSDREDLSGQVIIAKDGLTFSPSNQKVLYLSDQESTPFATIRGGTDFPGLLVTGRVDHTGRLLYSWGAKRSQLSVTKIGRGTYRVAHYLGHTNYTISVSIESGNPDRPAYQHVTSESFEIIHTNYRGEHFDYGFSFCIFGDNA